MEISLPGDKSISHRALMLAAIAEGTTILRNLSRGVDVTRTRECLEQCGCEFKDKGAKVVVTGRGGAFTQPSADLDAANSGTTARLLMGLLAGRNIQARLVGDESLSRRPMARVVEPLVQLGAQIDISVRKTLPVTINPANLESLTFTPPVASAQVKSALLLAGLASAGEVQVTEPVPSRNHTELMLRALGVDINVNGDITTIGAGVQPIQGFSMEIPGDPSSAAFLAALTTLLPHGEITFKRLMLNPTRLASFGLCNAWGGKLTGQLKSMNWGSR